MQMLQSDVSTQMLAQIQLGNFPNGDFQLLEVWQCPKSPQLKKRPIGFISNFYKVTSLSQCVGHLSYLYRVYGHVRNIQTLQPVQAKKTLVEEGLDRIECQGEVS